MAWTHRVYVNGKPVARFISEESANRYADKNGGEVVRMLPKASNSETYYSDTWGAPRAFVG